jgi:hypothetical protein
MSKTITSNRDKPDRLGKDRITGDAMKQINETNIRPKLRLAEVQRLIERNRIIVPTPSRRTLTRMCEDGRLEAASHEPGPLGWLVYEDSFWKWVKSLDGE